MIFFLQFSDRTRHIRSLVWLVFLVGWCFDDSRNVEYVRACVWLFCLDCQTQKSTPTSMCCCSWRQQYGDDILWSGSCSCVGLLISLFLLLLLLLLHLQYFMRCVATYSMSNLSLLLVTLWSQGCRDVCVGVFCFVSALRSQSRDFDANGNSPFPNQKKNRYRYRSHPNPNTNPLGRIRLSWARMRTPKTAKRGVTNHKFSQIRWCWMNVIKFSLSYK